MVLPKLNLAFFSGNVHFAPHIVVNTITSDRQATNLLFGVLCTGGPLHPFETPELDRYPDHTDPVLGDHHRANGLSRSSPDWDHSKIASERACRQASHHNPQVNHPRNYQAGLPLTNRTAKPRGLGRSHQPASRNPQ